MQTMRALEVLMLINGKKYLSSDRVAYLLGLSDKTSLSMPAFKKTFEKHKIKEDREYYYEQSFIHEYLDIRDAKSAFHVSIQALLMLIIDLSGDSKSLIAKRMGFNYLASMDNYLESVGSNPKDAFILVRANKYYNHIIKIYDEEY